MNFQYLLKWYSGKALEKATLAVALLEKSSEINYWVPKASRFCRSAFSKPTVAQKAFKKDSELGFKGLESKRKEEGQYSDSYFNLRMAVMYGVFSHLSNLNEDKINQSPYIKNNGLFIEFLNDFTILETEMVRLDSMRPLPVFTSLGVSPTITKTLRESGMNPDSVRVCPMKFYYVKQQINGKVVEVPVARLEWPKNIVFGTSRFTGSEQCQSCGHLIKNVRNWVPLIIDDTKGIPHAFMVGSDCAKNLYGIKSTIEFAIEEKTK